MNYQTFNKDNATTIDRAAWALCQIIDDDAPMRWTRYRFAAECIARNSELMADLAALAQPAAQAVAPDAATVESVMARADEYAHVYSFVRDNTMPIARDALRAAVEQVVAERDALRAQHAAQAGKP